MFRKVKKQFELKNIEHDVKLFKCTNMLVSHDNFYDKYLPIRTQALIRETMLAILSGKERRRLELYDHEKSGILYQTLLCDDGTGYIHEKMRDLHVKASIEVLEEDKRIKKKLAIDEASKQLKQKVGQFVVGNVGKGSQGESKSQSPEGSVVGTAGDASPLKVDQAAEWYSKQNLSNLSPS